MNRLSQSSFSRLSSADNKIGSSREFSVVIYVLRDRLPSNSESIIRSNHASPRYAKAMRKQFRAHKKQTNMIDAKDPFTRNHLPIILGPALNVRFPYFKSINYAPITSQTCCGQMHPTGQVRKDTRTFTEFILLTL
jgi:hypothetical protein